MSPGGVHCAARGGGVVYIYIRTLIYIFTVQCAYILLLYVHTHYSCAAAAVADRCEKYNNHLLFRVYISCISYGSFDLYIYILSRVR